jgi:hypothetical protein
VRQTLTLSANFSGGYDDNVTAGLGAGAAAGPAAMASGGTGYLDGTLTYFSGNTRHSLDLDATGSLSAYPGYLDDPAPGAIVNASVATTVGRDTRFRFSERAGYESLFNVYSQGASSAPLPPEVGGVAPTTGLFERRSWNTSTSAAVDQRWGGRDSTSLSYQYRAQEFTTDDLGDNRSHGVQADYRRVFSRSARTVVRYRYTSLDYLDADGSWLPTSDHRIEVGPEVQKSLSRRRQMTLSVTAGAVYVESVNSTTREPYEDWAPTGSATLNLALSPGWAVDGGYRREISTFQGVTDDIYATDTAFVGTGGMLSRRTNFRVSATYSNWRTPVVSGVTDTMDIYGASVQLRVAMTRTVGATVGYYYYYHRYSNPASLPEGFPAEYDRHAVRVGLSLSVPLVGAPTAPRQSSR